jgi:hypothetical protein
LRLRERVDTVLSEPVVEVAAVLRRITQLHDAKIKLPKLPYRGLLINLTTEHIQRPDKVGVTEE